MMRGYLRSIANSVKSFMMLAGQETPLVPKFPKVKDLIDREGMLVEEVSETQEVIQKIEELISEGVPYSEIEQNTELLQEYADGLLDVIYVAIGSLVNVGIRPETQEALMQMVCKANNAKFIKLHGVTHTRMHELADLAEKYPDRKIEVRQDVLGNNYAAITDPENGKVKKPSEWQDPKAEMLEILEKSIALGEQSYTASQLWGSTT